MQYYYGSYKNNWFVMSFRSADDVADRIARTFCYGYVDLRRLTFNEYLQYNLRYFSAYEIGAIKMEVGSRDPFSACMFFTKFVRHHYVASYRITN